MCHYNIKKYSFCARVVNIGNSLPNEVVEADTVNALARVKIPGTNWKQWRNAFHWVPGSI